MPRVAAHLAVKFPMIFTFLLGPAAIDATNWHAEPALRPAVAHAHSLRWQSLVARGLAQQIVASVLRTAHQRQFNVHALVVSLLRARRPHVSATLHRPPEVN